MKKKVDKFIKNFKKAEDPAYKVGQQLVLYKNEYTVMSCNGRNTLLRDKNGSPAAYPTERLSKMLRKSAEAEEMEKAGKKPSKMQSGMIRVDKVDKKGRKYHYYVHAQRGTTHHGQDPGSPQREDSIDEESRKHYMKMRSVINEHGHPSDLKKLHKELDDFIETKAAYRHLSDAHNQMISEDSANYTVNTVRQLGAKKDEYERKFNKLKASIKASKAKRS